MGSHPSLRFYDYSQTSHNPYPLVDSPGYGFSGVMGLQGGGKKLSAHKSHENLRKSYFLCYNRSEVDRRANN